MRGHTGHNTRPQSDCDPVSWAWMRPYVPDLTTERSFHWQATLVIDVLDMMSMGVCTTRHWQTSGRLVRELNAATVAVNPGCKIELRTCSKQNTILYFSVRTSFLETFISRRLYYWWSTSLARVVALPGIIAVAWQPHLWGYCY